jgi:hypothetical protein
MTSGRAAGQCHSAVGYTALALVGRHNWQLVDDDVGEGVVAQPARVDLGRALGSIRRSNFAVNHRAQPWSIPRVNFTSSRLKDLRSFVVSRPRFAALTAIATGTSSLRSV